MVQTASHIGPLTIKRGKEGRKQIFHMILQAHTCVESGRSACFSMKRQDPLKRPLPAPGPPDSGRFYRLLSLLIGNSLLHVHPPHHLHLKTLIHLSGPQFKCHFIQEAFPDPPPLPCVLPNKFIFTFSFFVFMVICN